MCACLTDTWCVVSIGECFLAKGYFVGATRIHYILFISLPPSFPTYLPTYLSTSLPPYLPPSLPTYLPTYLPPSRFNKSNLLKR